jgi:predicted GNAT superfamily acetyltransferase
MVEYPKIGLSLRVLETPDEMKLVEDMQRIVWPGSEVEIVPVSMLMAAVHGGGLLIGAFTGGAKHLHWPGEGEPAILNASPLLVGIVFGFPGFYTTPDGPRLKHCSHMLGVHPDYRDQGIGFRLKRAQWQMVRHQEIDRITWTYDPLLSRNAHLNIAKLGAVCNTYLRSFYGEMRDSLNMGFPSDRFEVDWWVNSRRVNRRVSRKVRRQLTIAHFLEANVPLIDPLASSPTISQNFPPLLLVEIPADFPALKTADPALVLKWRTSTRKLFEDLFARGYIVTDFVHESGERPRSFYVLSHGESTF